MIIDANGLFGRWAIRTPGIDDPDEFVRQMDAHEIDISIVVSLTAMTFDTVIGNGETIEACAAQPERLKGLCVANPKTDLVDPLEQMARCRDAGLVGLRLTPQHGYSYSDVELLAPVIEQAAEYDWPVWLSLVVVQNTPFGSQPVTAVGRVLDEWPEVRFIITGISYVNRLDALRVLKDRPNAWIDIATLQSAFCVDDLCEEPGAERVVLGTGFAVQCPGIAIAKVQHAEITQAEREAIMSGNIANLLGLC